MHHLLRVTVVLVCCGILILSPRLHAQSNDDKVNSVWNSLQKGSTRQAEQDLLQLVEAHSKNSRAHIVLSYLYSWQHRYKESFDHFEKAVQCAENPHALMYALMASGMAQKNSANNDFRMGRLYEKMIAQPDPQGILRAQSYSRMGDHERLIGNIDRSNAYYGKLLALDKWAVIGPFENVSGSGYNKVYGPEKTIDFQASYAGRYGSKAEWFVPSLLRPDKWFDMERHFVSATGVFYAYTGVYSAQKQKVSFRVGTSGAFKAFMNDENILSCEDEYNNDLDTYVCETELQSGWNKIVIKLCVWDINRNNFLLRLVDAAGNEIPGLQSTTDIKPFLSKPNAPVKRMDNLFERYFEQQVQMHPEYLENYLLLADCYIRNDQGERAEITLRDALRRSSNTVLLLDKMMEAYIRNDKRDLVSSTLEKIWAMDSTDINALEYKSREALNNKNYDEAERLVNLFEKVSPENDQVIAMKMLLYSSTNKEAQALDLLKSAYEKYPTNYAFVSGMSYLALQGKKDHQEALGIWKKYLDENYTYDALSAIAEIYNQQGDYSSWEKYRSKMQDLSNSAPGYCYANAKVYYGREDYLNAERMIRLCLQSCPNVADYHEMLGDVDRKKGDIPAAKKHYQTALKCFPGYLKMRETLRDMDGKKSIFNNFSSVNIDSLLKVSPTASSLPEDESVVILDDSKYVVYPEGTNESRFEILVRILKQEGIDEWKELNLGSDARIEKAVSIKPGGSELRADVNEGQMVFKSLQEGDFIYVRWRDFERGSDRFFSHFNAKRYLNGKYPYVLSRISVLAPNDFKLNYRTSNMSLEPNIRSTDDGKMYEWRLENQESIKSESAMPNLDVVGKYLEISSIDSWQYIADWYYDVTNLKTKVTYEIKEKVAELLGGTEKLSEEEILRRVYQFITDSIRYSSVSFRQSGGTPQKARDVLITKIGDCKDVATLGISMLSVAGIKAEYCLVKTNSASLVTQLPSRDFDHVIVRAHIGNRIRYLDFTASNYPIGSVPDPDVNAFSLLIQPGVKEAQRLSRENFLASTSVSSLSASLNDEGDLAIKRSTKYGGSLGAYMRHSFRSRGSKENDKTVAEDLSRLFPNVQLKSVGFTNLDTLAPSVTVDETFDAPHHVTEVGQFKLLKLPWFNTFRLDEAFSYRTREYPIEFNMGYDTTIEEISVTLANNQAPVELPTSVKKSSKFGDYSVSYSFVNQVLKARRVFVVKGYLITPEEYNSTKEFYNSIVKEDDKQILLGAATTGSGKKKVSSKQGK